jgi:hypothetical protein
LVCVVGFERAGGSVTGSAVDLVAEIIARRRAGLPCWPECPEGSVGAAILGVEEKMIELAILIDEEGL